MATTRQRINLIADEKIVKYITQLIDYHGNKCVINNYQNEFFPAGSHVWNNIRDLSKPSCHGMFLHYKAEMFV